MTSAHRPSRPHAPHSHFPTRVGALLLLLGNAACASRPSGGPSFSSGGGQETIEVDGWAGLAHRPIAALVERDAWIDVREPRFVLYDDGTMIFHSDEGVREATLDPSEKASFMARIASSGLLDMPADADFTGGISDQPTIDLFFRHHDRWKYGSYMGVMTPNHTSRGGPPPRGIAIAFAAMVDPHPRSDHAWVPERLRVVLNNCDQSSEMATAWPADIPAPDASRASAQAPGSGGLRMLGTYEHFVSGTYETQLRAFAVKLGGRPVAVGDAACSMDVLRDYPGEDHLRRVSACAWARLIGPRTPIPHDIPEGCRR